MTDFKARLRSTLKPDADRLAKLTQGDPIEPAPVAAVPAPEPSVEKAPENAPAKEKMIKVSFELPRGVWFDWKAFTQDNKTSTQAEVTKHIAALLDHAKA